VIGTDRREIYAGIGTPGLASADGVANAAAAILPLLAKAEGVERIGVGAAGAWTAPDAAAALARALADATGAHVAVTSDVVTAHAGALQGAFGTLLIAGTGAVALGVAEDGLRLVDGWGPDIGDLGSGSWIGREGARAVLRSRDALGPETALTGAVRDHVAPHPDPITWLAGKIPTARQLATLAPIVLDAAAAGDAVAADIVAEAVRLLTASALAASGRIQEVAVHGGLTDHSWFRTELERSLTAAGRTVVPAVGDAFDGAALLASRTDMPHERFVHRA
jgi:N-acetylglucosamine kinase-like BadF-type ATPase